MLGAKGSLRSFLQRASFGVVNFQIGRGSQVIVTSQSSISLKFLEIN